MNLEEKKIVTFSDCKKLNLDLKFVTGKEKDVKTLHLPKEIKEQNSKILCDCLETLEEDDKYHDIILNYAISNTLNSPGLIYKKETAYVKTKNSFLIVEEAEPHWPREAIPRTILKASYFMKKSTPVFAVLTNSKFFKFYAIDVDGTVYSSGKEIVLVKKCPWSSNEELIEILKWFHWIFNYGT